jgi:cellulose synthase/poly-beta-1,6-N-acetylglucosamine synthase-like glycosyltransferase
MCVAPLLAVYNPQGFLKRLQQIEYFFGIYLREVFTSLNSANVTPGAFSAYRKVFFDKHGGFDENNLTEDLEIALRIQYYNYLLENCTTAIVYTETPENFASLLKQRRRWYTGLLRNLWDYTGLFSKKYGALGMIVLPLALISVVIAMIVTSYTFIKLVQSIKAEFVLLHSINFNFLSVAEFSRYSFGRGIYSFFSEPLSLFTVLFLLIMIGYMLFAKRKVKEHSNIFLGFPLFMLFYSFFYAFWWVISIVYTLFNRKVAWR